MTTQEDIKPHETDKEVTALALRDGLSEIEVLDDWLGWKIDTIEKQLVDCHDLRPSYQKAYSIVRDRMKFIAETKKEIQK